MKMWVSVGSDRTQKNAFVSKGAFRIGPFDAKGTAASVKFSAYFNGAWQPQSVLALVGERGQKVSGKLFRLTEPDVIDSEKILDAKFVLPLPQVAPEANAISIVKHAILTVPGQGTSATNIEENLALFEKAGTKPIKGWSATLTGANVYNVSYDFDDGGQGEQQAIW